METWFRLPREVRVVIGAAVAFSFAVLAFLAWDFDRLHNGFNGSRIVGWLALAGLIGPLASLFVLGGDDGLRRRFGSIEEFISYNRALRTAELPARIDPDVWRDWLHVSRRTNRMAQLLAYLVVAFVVLPSLIRQPWYHP